MAHKAELLSSMQSRLWIGAGIAKTVEHVKTLLANEDIDGIIFGSITPDEKFGNPGTTFYAGDGYTLNSIGLTNAGMQKYEHLLPLVAGMVQGRGKQIIVSVAADDPAGYAKLVQLAIDSGADGAELNLGCPNKWGADGKQKDIPSHNRTIMKNILVLVGELDMPEGFMIGVKLSPLYPSDVPKAAQLINRFAFVTYVATANTVPNCYAETETETSCISTHAGNTSGYGGMAGAALFPIALGQVKLFRPLLREDIAIMGVGGIDSGEKMHAFIKNGADVVQVVSAYYHNERVAVFSEILEGYMELFSKAL